MKVIYYSKPFFADCDFPLIKALQDKGIDVRYYMPLPRNFIHSTILEFNKPITQIGFVKASRMKEMEIYKDCIDLDRLYFIKGYPMKKLWIPSWLLWFYTLWHMKQQKADIIHIDWQIENYFERFLFKYSLGRKKIMTVHDPIMHSELKNAQEKERRRIWCFNWADNFILLDKNLSQDFSNKYSIDHGRISFSRLGRYNSISHVLPMPSAIKGDYILFFGQITPHKGIDILVKSMILVHKTNPDVKLVIAGRGEISFNVEEIETQNYIEFKNYYIGISELVGLVKDSLLVVCPYKDATQSGVVQTAFSLEKPVIATNVGNMSKVVKDGETGLIVPPCDVVSLKEAIIRLINNKKMLNSFVENIKKYNIEDDSWDNIADDYLKVYKA